MGPELILLERMLKQLDELEDKLRRQQEIVARGFAGAEGDDSIAQRGLLIAGAALGLAVGVMTGLAQSPTVGAVAAGTVGLGSTWIGLHNNAGRFRAMLGFVTGFALLLAVTTPLALMARSHALFAADPKDVVNKYLQMGMDDDLATRLALIELGFKFPGTDTTGQSGQSQHEAAQPIEKVPSASEGNLLAGPAPSSCDEITNKLLRAEVPLSKVVVVLEQEEAQWKQELAATRAALRGKVQQRCSEGQ